MSSIRKQENHNSIEYRDWYLLAGFILLGIGIRCFMWYWIESSFLGDMIHYVDIAKDIGEGYILKAVRAATPPLYPLLIRTFYLFIQDYDISARLVNVVFGGLLVYPVFQMAYLVYGRRTAVLAGCLVVFAGELVNYSLLGYAESIYLFFITMAIYKVVKAIRLKSNWEMFYSGLFFGLSFLTKKQAIAFIAFTLIWVLAVLAIEKKRVVARGILGVFFLVVGYGIMVAPYHYLQQLKEPAGVSQRTSVTSKYATNYKTYFHFNLRYESEYMSQYILHRDQNGYYHLGGGQAGASQRDSHVLSEYLSVLVSRLLKGFPGVVNRLFPFALLFFLIGLIKKDWDIRVEGYLVAVIIVNIMATSQYYWNSRYLNTLMPVVLVIGSHGIVRSGALLEDLMSKILPLFERWGPGKEGKGWTILLAVGIILSSLVLLLLQKPDYSYNARIKHQKEVAEQLRAKFGNNLEIMSWGIGRSAIPYYMGIKLSQVRVIPIASMDMIMGYAKQEGVSLLAFDTEEMSPGRFPGILELLKNKGEWPGLQLVMASPRGQHAITSGVSYGNPDVGLFWASPKDHHDSLVSRMLKYIISTTSLPTATGRYGILVYRVN